MGRLTGIVLVTGAILVCAAASVVLLHQEPLAPDPLPPLPAIEGPLPLPAPVPFVAPPIPMAAPAAVEVVEEDDGWREYPEGVKGPVVVGIVSKYGDADPECWVALESADDPARPDPSVVETLEDGRFRVTGMAPGRYRVRVKEDETLPTYSRVLDLRDGAVTDAGVLRLNRRGFISGVLRDAAGAEVPGEVRLFGRDPATLETKVLESVPSIHRQGYQVAAHEAGEFTLAATGDAGFAVHRGKTDRDGLATADLALRPWASLDGDLAPAAADAPEVRGVRIVLSTLEAPDLGIPAAGGNRGAPARFERLPPGTYRVEARWEERHGEEWIGRKSTEDRAVAEGEAARATLPR